MLQTITEGPFEPTCQASLQAWTWKSTFLVAITTAVRVGEIQALDVRPELFQVYEFHATLRLNPYFIPKSVNVEYLNHSVELEGFFPDPRICFEWVQHSLCPCRALLVYKAKTEAICLDNQHFVCYQPGKQCQAVKKDTMSCWIKQMIFYSYRKVGREIPRNMVRTHSTQSVASTLADIGGVSQADLCQVATWSSASVFAHHYRRNMITLKGISMQVLTAGVATGRQLWLKN